tara:strand:+ start:1383 stop:2156 length:774 start_codon:yes stop_codon:yes gene_type:complete
VANEKGGVGKSLCSLALFDRLTLEGETPAVIQIDRQRRLADVIGTEVLTIESDPKASRVDPEIEFRRFSPILELIESTAGNAPLVIDCGAGEVGRFATWAAMVDLEEDLQEWGITCHILVPFLSEPEAIRQAVWSAEKLKSALTTSTIHFIENCRDGRLSIAHPLSATAAAVEEHLKKWQKSCHTLVFPAIPGGSWRLFEAARCRFIDVVDMSTAQTIAATGLPRAEAKIARGDVSQWLVTVFNEFDRALGLGESSQ